MSQEPGPQTAGGPGTGDLATLCRKPSWLCPCRGPPGRCPVLLESVSLPPRRHHTAAGSPSPDPAHSLPGAQGLADSGLSEGWWLREGAGCTPYLCARVSVHAGELRLCVSVLPRAQEHEHVLRGCSCVCTFACVYLSPGVCAGRAPASVHVHSYVRTSVWTCVWMSMRAHTCVAERVHTLQCVNVWTCVCR